jgi:hypothetical protein
VSAVKTQGDGCPAVPLNAAESSGIRNVRGGKGLRPRFRKRGLVLHTYPFTLYRPLIASLHLRSPSSIGTGWSSCGPHPPYTTQVELRAKRVVTMALEPEPKKLDPSPDTSTKDSAGNESETVTRAAQTIKPDSDLTTTSEEVPNEKVAMLPPIMSATVGFGSAKLVHIRTMGSQSQEMGWRK